MSVVSWARTAFTHTKRTLVIGAGNNPQRVRETGGLSREYVIRQRHEPGEWQSEGDGHWTLSAPGARLLSGPDRRENVREWAKRGEDTRAGNCGVHAAVAFEYLAEKSSLCGMISYAMLNNPGDHCFVVLNRDTANAGTVPAQWGGEAVICDPWGGFVCTQPQLIGETGASLEATVTQRRMCSVCSTTSCTTAHLPGFACMSRKCQPCSMCGPLVLSDAEPN
jgi:hypothetical protein